MKFSAYEEEVKETREPVAFICGNTLYIVDDLREKCYAMYGNGMVSVLCYNVWIARLSGASKYFYPGDKIVIEV